MLRMGSGQENETARETWYSSRPANIFLCAVDFNIDIRMVGVSSDFHNSSDQLKIWVGECVITLSALLDRVWNRIKERNNASSSKKTLTAPKLLRFAMGSPGRDPFHSCRRLQSLGLSFRRRSLDFCHDTRRLSSLTVASRNPALSVSEFRFAEHGKNDRLFLMEN